MAHIHDGYPNITSFGDNGQMCIDSESAQVVQDLINTEQTLRIKIITLLMQ